MLNKKYANRLQAMLVAAVCILLVLMGRMAYLQLFKGDFYGEQADHALVVVGIDTSDPYNVQVIVTDPGNGNRQMAYPAEQFMNAWKDSDCFMVATDEVPTNSSFSHIDSFAGIPIDTLDRLSGMDINMDNGELYSNFVDEIMENPSSLDELMSSSYQGLFDQDSDSDNESDGE